MNLLKTFQSERPSLPSFPFTPSRYVYKPSLRLSMQDISAMFPEEDRLPVYTPRTSAQRRQLIAEREMEKRQSLIWQNAYSGYRRRRRLERKADSTAISTQDSSSEALTNPTCERSPCTRVRRGNSFHFQDGQLIDVKTVTNVSPYIPVEWDDASISMAYERHSFNGVDSAVEDILGRYSLPDNIKL
ncbi:hypothetical protein Ae201684P_010981 [Aphanomyces euteiches]|uniref:Uncharacterized protein n=1 Tax=Aphanomyces euteiches TaxID=100861 RepID=A0A6G0XWF0_9STRA|nr:hypothetical protein Ae201684_000618 [Aphanomyces euteiches]KAH9091435.1 hypothetical protein Ae201684P_010981 [Aphanomyces euteiches]